VHIYGPMADYEGIPGMEPNAQNTSGEIFPLPRSSTVDRLGQAEAIRQVVLSWIAPTIGQELANGGLGSYTFI
jgi:hypothetical protein